MLATIQLAFAACGGDGTDDTSENTADATASATTDPDRAEPESASTEGRPATTGTEATDPEPEDSATTDAEDIGEEASIELTEWSISDPGTLPPGTIRLTLDNVGENRHALAIARGARYEDLPRKQNGAVDTAALGDDYLGASDTVDPGATGTVEFEVAAGEYVLFCPIEFGPNSHAGAGQVLGVTVGS